MYPSGFRHPTLALLTIVLLAVLPVPPPARAHDDPCIWTGAISSDWFDKNNWSTCADAIPDAHDDVQIPVTLTSPEIDTAQSDVTVENLTLLGASLAISDTRTLTATGELRAESDARIMNDGTISGALVVTGGSTLAHGRFEGPITVDPSATLAIASSAVLEATGSVTVNGTLTNSSFLFRGATFTNNGTVSVATLAFRRVGPQRIVGAGMWQDIDRLSIAGGSSTALANDLILDVGRLEVGAGELVLRDHTLTIGGTTVVSVDPNSRIGGSGTIRTGGNVRITADGPINPTLWIAAGSVTAGGIFGGPISVAISSTLRVAQVLTATNSITLSGTLSGANGTLRFSGRTFTNDGVVTVSSVLFQGSQQTLSGPGIFAATNTTVIEPGARLTLASDHQMGTIQIGNGGTLDISGRVLSLAGDGTPLIRTGQLNTSQSGIIYNGTTPQKVATNVGYHDLTVKNSAGTATGAGTLVVAGRLRTAPGTFTTDDCDCNDVRIEAGATLATGLGSAWNLTGNWANHGVYTAGIGNTMTFNGTDSQTITGTQETAFYNLTITNPNGVELATNASVNANLTLNSDLRTGERTLLMPAVAISAGDADVFGNVKRAGPLRAGIPYSFGSPFASLTFDSAGTLPNEITVSLTKGKPATLAPAVDRAYTIDQKGGNGWSATLRLHYRDTELNGLLESALQPSRFDPAQQRWIVQPRTAANTTDNWVERSGVTMLGEWGLTARYQAYLPLIRQTP